MPDMTITWKGAVSFDAFKGQSASSKAGSVQFDAAAMAAGFEIRPLCDESMESSLAGAVPYMADDEADFDWATDFEESRLQIADPVKRGRPKKGS